ncbi:uncharacterized protein LOC123876084 isoform X2 [Maniola jurtina]|uniref:uncharacterized protein LOC123876084 isoform X2 n=1 Tax=Maniola jurtina TaxID=191418 RepID=UPI001E68B928|nr:uncharacterized protein LOC123876084 isoform X2 [Maniola jurtina]
MNQCDQNINKDMIDSDLIDVESLDFSDDQTWLYTIPGDSGEKVDLVEFNLACDWPIDEDEEYLKLEKELNDILDKLLQNEVALPDKHKFDSRTYVRPKKRMQRPSIQSIVEVSSNPPSMSPHPSLNSSPNKYLTYNKYNNPLGPISPMLRLKTFNVDTNTENSHVVKDFAMKRRGVIQDDDPQLEDTEGENSTPEHVPFKAINIDLSQPAHNIHNTFNKGIMHVMQESSSMNMYRSGESLMRMSPPSLVSSMLENSGNFNAESMDSRKSQRDSGLPMSGRDSIDPMMTSMTLSILDEKDMSTSFLSQTTYPDNDSFMDSLPPSLVNSVNSSYVVSNSSKAKTETNDTNIFSSATFTHLEQSEKLLSARPRCHLYNSVTKRDSIKNSESYTKAKEEACQIDTVKVLNENCDNNLGVPQPKNSPKTQNKPNGEMSETITLHYSNNKFRRDNDAEKENMNRTFQCDDTFYKDMGIPKTQAVDQGKSSMNVTLDKQELNEIIQARQKLSLARKALPSEPDKPSNPVNQVDTSPVKTIQLPNQTVITVPKQSMENASELLSRRRAMNNYDRPEEHMRETPKRNATFKKPSPTSPKTFATSALDATVVHVKADDNNIIDINSATMSLIDSGDRALNQEDWGMQERAMVGSSESTGTDTGTFSSSSPPESVPDTVDPRAQVASTPLMLLKRGVKQEFLDINSTISPIYDNNMVDDKSYTVNKVPNSIDMGKTYFNVNDKSYTVARAPNSNDNMGKPYLNTAVINSATMVKKTSAKRDIMAAKNYPEKKISAPSQMVKPAAVNRVSPTENGLYSVMPPPATIPRKTCLPTSKLRQYSSHKELNRIPGNPPSSAARVLAGRTMVRRGVYASNPALSPTAPVPPTLSALAVPQRRESYTIATHQREMEAERQERPTLMNPPALVRQGTETLRRERPQSQLVAPKDLRLSAVGPSGVPVSLRNHYAPPPTTRPYSIAGTSQLRVSRPASVPLQKTATVTMPQVEQPRPSTGVDRMSALPRPSRLPAPRRGLRPPSVYSVAPTGDTDQY